MNQPVWKSGSEALKKASNVKKVRKSKIELIGPMNTMKSRIRVISQCRGFRMNEGSTLSVGMVTWARSYRKLFSKICLGNMGRKGRNKNAAAMLNILPKFELLPMKRYFMTL